MNASPCESESNKKNQARRVHESNVGHIARELLPAIISASYSSRNFSYDYAVEDAFIAADLFITMRNKRWIDIEKAESEALMARLGPSTHDRPS